MGVRRRITEQYFRQLLAAAGMPFMGEIHVGFNAGSSTSLFEEWLESNMDLPAEFKHQGNPGGLTDGENAISTGRNDALILMPGTYTLTSLLTWDKSNTHLIGAHSGSPWSNNVIVQHTGATALSPFITISGSDNLIKNIHFIAGGSHANQHANIKNTGSGNHYENCWFEGPTNATQADDTSNELVLVDGGGNFFKNCMFGSTASPMGGAALLGFTGSAYRSTFENCIFYMQADNVAAVMLDLGSAFDISGPQFFKNCLFHAWWTNQADMANYLIRGAAAIRTGNLHFQGCSVVGFDDIVEAGGEAAVFFDNQLTGAPDGTYAGLVVNVTAG